MQLELKQVNGLINALNARALNSISVSAGAGLTGGGDLSTSRTLALTGQALALHNLSTSGLIARTGSGTVAGRTLTGISGRISVTNGDGVSGNPTIDLASGVIGTPGTYQSVTVDTYGRITAGTNPTTLAGYGITDALSSGGGSMAGSILFSNSMGVSNPTLNSRGAGTRIVLRDNISVSTADFAIGYNTNKIWFSLGTNSNTQSFEFYAGTVSLATLKGDGSFNVNGDISAVTKSFLIPHPTRKGMKLQYSSLEGPEIGIYVRGRCTGTAVIKLPPYWRKLVREGTITVHITSANRYTYYCDGVVRNNSLYVVCSTPLPKDDKPSGDVSDYDFFYIVMAERADVAPLKVERKA